VLPLHRHSAPPDRSWQPRRDRGEKEKITEKNTEERGLRRETEERREGRKTPLLSPPPSTTADDHNCAFPLQVNFFPLPVVFSCSSSFCMQNVSNSRSAAKWRLIS
jgi:hypothetical protein